MRVRRTTSSGSPLPKGVTRGCGTLFFGAFAAAGVVFTILLLVSFAGAVRPYFWEEKPCIIVESHRVEPEVEKSRTDGEFVIGYRYMANGQYQTSRQFSLGITESREESAIERLLSEYPVDATARCYVNPSNPKEAVLRRGPLWVFAFILLPLAFVAGGVAGIIRIWTFGTPAAESVTRRAARTGARMGGIFLGTIFTLVGAGIVYGLTVLPALRVLRAKSWEEVPCKILRSEVGSHRGNKGGRTYSVDITYQYNVGGRDYRSDRYQFLSGSSSGYNGKAEVVKRYPVNAVKTCFVNSKDPTDAVLDRSFHPSMFIGLTGLVFLLIGIVVLAGSRRSHTPQGEGITAPSRLNPLVPPSIPAPTGTSTIPAGPLELESASSPMGRFLCALIFAVIWNGITGVFVGVVISSWIKKKPEIFLSIFMVPFVLVGVVIVVFVFHSLLNLLNPRIRLIVNSAAIGLGGKLHVRWRFRGRSSRIKQLQIALAGSEKARYSRGTDNRTDTRVFARLPMVNTTDPMQISDGQAQLVVPQNSMHTFRAPHNEIIWTLKVHGDVPRFPDVSDEFPITILPRG